jgi:hypothetical protein
MSFPSRSAYSPTTSDPSELDSLLSQIHNQSGDYQTEEFFSFLAKDNFHPDASPSSQPERHFEGISLSHQELNPNASYFEPKGVLAQERPSSSVANSNPFLAPGDKKYLTSEFVPEHRDSHSLYPPFFDQVQPPNSYESAYEQTWKLQTNFLPQSQLPRTHQLPYRSKQPLTVAARPILPRPSNDLKRDQDLELAVSHCARIVLYETPSKCLKSVELANSLRDRIGKDSLQRTKALYGGLLVLLELYPQYFFVHRIPKNDMIELVDHSSPYGSFVHHPHRSMESAYQRFPNPPVNYQMPPPVPMQPKPVERIREIKPPAAFVTPARPTDHFIIINDVPDALTGGDLWREFGGAGIVQKVSLDFQATKRTAIIYFTSDEVATQSFQLHSTGKWKGCLVYRRNVEKKAESQLGIDNLQPVASSNSTENRLVTLRSEQLPQFYQDVLRELCNFNFTETDTWKRCTLPDYLFCQLMTELLKPHAGVPLPTTKLKDTLRDTFRRTILLPPLKGLLRAYPEFFDVNDDASLVRATNSELPSLNEEDLIS